ncbi:unnamed protein product [Cunninghamella blakesleeana]
MVAEVANNIHIETNDQQLRQQTQRKRNRKKTKKQRAEEEAQRKKELESLIKKDYDDDVDLKGVEFEYVIEPIHVTKLQGDSEVKDDIID